MKEYILVILSGICKAVEKTKWPEDIELCKRLSWADCYKDDCKCERYERQKREAFEGGALVECLPRDVVESFFESGMVLIIDADFNNGGEVELVRHGKYFSSVKEIGDEEGFAWETMTNRLNLKDGAYPIDPSKWEIIEQWQYLGKLDKTWVNCHGWFTVDNAKEYGNETRLTAVIKPKENSAHAQEGQTNGVRNSLNSSGLEIGTAIGEPQEPTKMSEDKEALKKEFEK